MFHFAYEHNYVMLRDTFMLGNLWSWCESPEIAPQARHTPPWWGSRSKWDATPQKLVTAGFSGSELHRDHRETPGCRLLCCGWSACILIQDTEGSRNRRLYKLLLLCWADGKHTQNSQHSGLQNLFNSLTTNCYISTGVDSINKTSNQENLGWNRTSIDVLLIHIEQ